MAAITISTRDADNSLLSPGHLITYTWSARGQLLAEYTHGYPVRTFTYDGAGRLTQATVFTLTTRFTYNGLGDRLAVAVVGQGMTTYTLDLAAGSRILAEETLTGTVRYLYGPECLGELRNGQWLYYLADAEGLVRQGVNAEGEVVSAWLFDPDGVVLEGPEGPVSHLVCSGVYDWSTGLIYKGGRYFDPTLGIWLALMPLVVQGWRKRKEQWQWGPLVCVGLFVVGSLAGCERPELPNEEDLEVLCTEVPTIPNTPRTLPLTTNFTLLAGSDVQDINSLDVEISSANQVLNQPITMEPGQQDPPRIQIVRGDVKRMNEEQTRQVLGGDLIVNILTGEPSDLFQYNRRSHNGIDLTVYYVQDIDFYVGGAAMYRSYSFGASILIENDGGVGVPRTLAHEVMHILGLDHLSDEDDKGIMHGVARENYDDNLMISGGSGEELSWLQLQRAAQGYRNSPRLYPMPTPSW